MLNPTTTPPPKGPRGKHRHSRSAAGQIGQMESSHPQNSHLRQNLNSNYHLSNSSLSQGLTDPSDNDSQGANLTDGPATPPRTPKPRGAGRTISDGSAVVGTSVVSKQRKQRTSVRPKDAQMSSSPAPPSGSATPPVGGAARNAPLTPGRTSNTPSKTAYAGPTFHASPAPSALPLPSFFSKSLPPSGNSLQAMLEEDGSDNSETSSCRDSPPALVERQIREESPLDIFFRADKEEKAKARRNNVGVDQFDSPSSNAAQIGSPSYLRNPSPFSIGPSRDSATPEMFAMDSDSGSNSRKPYGPAFSTPYNERINTIRANTAPSNMTTQTPSDEEQRKAKTQALKDLLFSPQSRRPATLSPQSDEPQYYSDGGHASPSPLAPRSSYVQRTSSGPSTPAPSLKAQRSPRSSNFHFLHESLLATANGSPSPVTRLSNLRQEVIPPKSPERSGAPSFPTRPTLTDPNKLDVSTISRNYISSHINGDFSKPSYSLNGLPQATGMAVGMENIKGSADLKNMENDLRRILKMDVAPDAGSAGSAFPVSVPLPGYIDGRPAPMNGMKNGVLGS